MAKDLNVFDKEYGLLINGEWTKGSEGKLLSSYNPANGDELAKFTDATDARCRCCPWPLRKKRSKHGVKPRLPNARPF